MNTDITLVSRRPYDDLPEICKMAEDAGFTGVWSAENAHDAFLPLSLVATSTRRLEIGTKIAVAFARTPMNIAYIAWDLQMLSGGRFILGLGSQVKGHVERRFDMPWSSPAPRMKEAIQSLRTIWGCWQSGAPLDFRGRFYNFTLMPAAYTPEPIEHPSIPIYISAVNEYMCRVVGEVCDGVHLHPFNTTRYLQEVVVPQIAVGASHAGRSLNDITLCLSPMVATGRTSAELEAARDEMRQVVSFYASTRTYAPFMEFNGWGELVQRLHRLSMEGKWDDMSRLVSNDMLDAICIVCQPDEVIPRIKERFVGLAHRVSFNVELLQGQGATFWRQLVRGLA